MLTATRNVKTLDQNESIINDAPKLHTLFEPGTVSHQGDLMIVAIAALPASARPRENRQLAIGNTQGARHILERGEVYDADPQDIARCIKAANGCEVPVDFIGPVFVSPPDPTENDLTHPEHGNQGFPAGAVCAVVYQVNLDEQQRRQRTQD